MVLLLGCGDPTTKEKEQEQENPPPLMRVTVEAQLGADGQVKEVSVTEGDTRFRAAALEVAKTAPFPLDCDDDGHPIPSSTKIFIYFDVNGKIVKTEFPVRVGGQIKASRIRKRVEPVYPKAAKLARIQGLVLLKVWIDKEGNPTRIEPVRGPEELIPAATAAVKQWKWKPTFLGCEPVPVIATVPVNFVLR